MKAVIRTNMFTLTQDVYLKGEHGASEYKLKLEEIPNFLMQYEDLTDLYIYGSEMFTTQLVKEIKEQELIKYKHNNINIHISV